MMKRNTQKKPLSDPAPSGWPSKNRAIACKLQRAKSLHEQRGLQIYIQKAVATSDRVELVNYIEFAWKSKNRKTPQKNKLILHPWVGGSLGAGWGDGG